MATKAKKKVHPMPKLGWKDMLLYWSAMALAFSMALSFIFVGTIQEKIAFSDPAVIAQGYGQGNWLFIIFMLWGLFAFVLLLAGPYQHRIPIFGRSDIKYGPPAYPRIYPIFMKNKPQFWISQKELQRKKKIKFWSAVILAATFLISAVSFSLSFYGRTVLRNDSSILVYNSANNETEHYSPDQITDVELGIYSTRSKGGLTHWHIEFTITTTDRETYRFPEHAFAGTALEELQTMLQVKQSLFADRFRITDTDKFSKVLAAHPQPNERALLYQLFEITP